MAEPLLQTGECGAAGEIGGIGLLGQVLAGLAELGYRLFEILGLPQLFEQLLEGFAHLFGRFGGLLAEALDLVGDEVDVGLTPGQRHVGRGRNQSQDQQAGHRGGRQPRHRTGREHPAEAVEGPVLGPGCRRQSPGGGRDRREPPSCGFRGSAKFEGS